jgi:hypothetical protein
MNATAAPVQPGPAPVFIDPEPTVEDVPRLTRSGLTRRVPGSHMAEAFQDLSPELPTIRTTRDPEAEREAINDFLAGLARGSDTDTTDQVHSSSPTAAERPT